MKKYPPTKEQIEFRDFVLNAPSRSVVFLTGEGGSGKTEAIASLPGKESSSCVRYLCPTHQAAHVLYHRLFESGVAKPNVRTVASFVKKRPNNNVLPDDDNLLGSDFSYSSDAEKIGKGNILVLDEVSQVSLEDVVIISNAVADGVLVMTGDFKQIPPVNAASCYEALMSGIRKGKVTMFELRDNHRSESPQLTAFLNLMRWLGHFPPEVPDDGSVIYVRNGEEFHKMWVDAMKEHGTENVFYLAYRNDTVSKAAEMGRKAQGYSGDFANVGEVLRVNKPFQFLTWKEACEIARSMSKDDPRIIREILAEHTLQCGDQIRIIERSPAIEYLRFPWCGNIAVPVMKTRAKILTGPCKDRRFELSLTKTGDCSNKTSVVWDLLRAAKRAARAAGENIWQNVPVDQVDAIRKMVAESPNREKGWWFGKMFYAVQGKIMNFSDARSMTVHKSQGSGASHVFVNSRDIGGPEADQLRYTAASRARKQLVVLL